MGIGLIVFRHSVEAINPNLRIRELFDLPRVALFVHSIDGGLKRYKLGTKYTR